MIRYQIVKYNEHTETISAVRSAYKDKVEAIESLIEIAAASKGFRSVEEWKEYDDEANASIAYIGINGEWKALGEDRDSLWMVRWRIVEVHVK
jgi:hypothetical protein